MKKTGSLLKDKRESANLSLSEVALATKINPKILLAIENGDEAHLPAKTFLKGFIKSYALFLKMDVEEVLRSYQDETGGPPAERVHEAYKTEASPNGTPTSRRRVEDENSSGLRTAAVVVIVVLIGLIIGVRELIEKYQREKVITSSEAQKVSPLTQAPAVGEDGKAAEAPTLTNNAAVSPVVSEPVAVTPALSPAPAPAPAAVVPAVKVEPTPEPAHPKPAKVSKSEESEDKAPPAKKIASVADTKPAEVTKPAIRNEIILEALDNVDIKMQIKGETKRLSLGPTQVHTIHSSEPVVLDFSDGGAVSIILNGHERGPVGELGKPKQITVP